jgi:hypothetical protein
MCRELGFKDKPNYDLMRQIIKGTNHQNLNNLKVLDNDFSDNINNNNVTNK